MAQSLRDVMTPDPITVHATSSVVEAAQKMRDADVGPVIVVDDRGGCGIVTARDITIRAVAEGRNPSEIAVDEICSHDVVSLSPDDSVDQAVQVMRENAIRRVAVVEGDRPVGIVSLGDIAMEQEPDSALADISEAPPQQ